ncbi:raffinose synthase [Candidatus Bathyarchaeota archaeon]|nr:raffinose synthase [Candidatus Bathyarchaeota archaeon]
MSKPILNVGNVKLSIASVTVAFADKSSSLCEYEGLRKEDIYEVHRYKCRDAIIDIYVSSDGKSCILGFSAASLKNLDSERPLEIELASSRSRKALVLTTHKDAAKCYSNAFGYYNQIAIGKEPRGSKPPDDPEYPPKLSYIEHEEYTRGYPCWSYPMLSEDFDQIPYYSIFLLANYGSEYLALLTLTNGHTTTYIEPGLKLRAFLGETMKNVELNWMASISIDCDPYNAVKTCIKYASSYVMFKLRRLKKQPIFIDRIGWCSWNALLTEDLSHYNVIGIVKGLLDRGLRLGWVVIDDGWQDEVRKEDWPRRILRRLSANERFPEGLKGVVEGLKKLGVDLVGLWHTINIHWSGFDRTLAEELNVKSYFSMFNESYVPPSTLNEAFEFYEKFFSWVKINGLDFVKVDNQWVIHVLYDGDYSVGRASKNVELALQSAAYAKGLDILNCMCMAPENYSHFLFSNAMRISMDYIPFWKADAKLHTIFSVYNALLFSHITYPDYDMFMSYDPYAKVHAVARLFSSGPIYITDREPAKTDLDLLKRFILPDGRLVKVDEPALPTRDILFRDPYNEPILLKIASKAGRSIVVAAFNVNRIGEQVEDSLTLDALPLTVERGEYVYYKVFGNEYGLLKTGEKLNISLGELEVEVITLAPVKNGRAVVGLKEYILPSALIKVLEAVDGRIFVKAATSGTLLYYSNGVFNEAKVEKESPIEVR